MTQQGPRQITQRAVWDKILNKVRDELIKPALSAKNIGLDQVQETRFRWDALDITVAWPKDGTDRNVHAWLTDEWPTYRLNFEGAAWQDDWEKLKRRVLFFKGPWEFVELSPPWNDPKVDIANPFELSEKVGALVREVQEADLSSLDWEYDLQPHPSMTRFARG